jgi:serine/threonine-protein kinase HipA
MANERKNILVYADWQGLNSPALLGTLSAIKGRGKETFSFEYSEKWLKSGFSQMLDPDLQMYSGAYYPREDKTNFGIFLDSCPDRWGRVLMQRREAALARLEKRSVVTLLESDYLLGVFDGHRMGALRFKLSENGSFLNNNREMAAPPWTSLRELEEASLKYEEDNINDPEFLKWVNILIAPGSSLGGARPKASVIDADRNLWIAKFPSRNDEKNIGAWEMVVNELAISAGLNVAEGMVQQFNNKYQTYLTKRFDRTAAGDRIHFASAMTLLGYSDGENSQGVSYLELVQFLTRHGANLTADLEELWRRIVFSICVKNTDDHLRNHGFLLTPHGWILSPAYDINPNEYGTGLHLNINENDNALNLDLALSVARYFRLTTQQAGKIIERISDSVSKWAQVADKFKISKAEQERMSSAFLI